MAAIYIATFILAIVTLLPLWRHSHWSVRGLDFPRLQFAALSLLLLLAQIVFLDIEKPTTWIVVIVTIACLGWHIYWIAPYTPLWPKEVKTASSKSENPQLCIITANVLTTNHNAESLRSLIKHYKPDVLVTLESDHWWQEQLSTLESEMPHTVKCPLDNFYGIHLYSRLPLNDATISFLVEKEVPSIHTQIQLTTGDWVRMHCMHPAPPSPTENEHSSERDAELIIVARSVADSDQPIIVCGDFNDVAWSATTRLFRKISGLLDPRIGRGIFNTFHAKYPFIRWPLDHLFHSKHFTVQAIQRLPPIGSDHYALMTKLSFSPDQGQQQQTGVKAKDSDHSWAKLITQNQNLCKNDVPKPEK
jgi:endonuclease/exonuclease/phosphatase (EEP) superfamily protein YafD